MTYTEVFGGNTVYPSDVSFLALDLDADVTLQWPLEASTGDDLVARIINVTPGSAGLSLTMPPADQAGVGQVIQFKNLGPDDFDVLDNDGGTLLTIADGEIWTLELIDNSDAAGMWQSFQAGSVTSQAQASALAGFGLVATGPTLSQEQDVTTFSMDYTAGASDRAKAYVWTGGLGTLTLTAAATLGNGWFMSLRNEGSGNLVVDCSGADNINGAGSITLRPADSCAINCDGSAFYTVGLGQDPIFAFDYTTIDLTGAGATYTLSGAELNRIAYQFFGTLSNNVKVVVPATTQQYWIANDTSGGSYTVSVATATQGAPVVVNRGARGIYYCQGTEVVHAETASISVPIAISDGGTGATTASDARINLGGTSVGIGVFTASSTGAAQTALGASAVGASVFTAANAAAAQTAIGATATGASLFTAANAAAALAVVTPLTTKGDLFTFSSASARLAVGSNGQVLTADSGEATGLKWAAVSAGTVSSVDASGGTTGLTFSGGPITTSGTLTLAGTLVVANGGTGATTLTGILKGNGTSAFSAATAGTDYVAPATATNFTAQQTFTGATGVIGAKFVSAKEKVTIVASAPTGTINFDITTQSDLYWTTNASANWTINLRGDGSNSLDSLMSTGEEITVVFRSRQGGTAYYNNVVQVDGTTSGVTTIWLGAAPSAGVASARNIYTYNVLKTGSATFEVTASLATFA